MTRNRDWALERIKTAEAQGWTKLDLSWMELTVLPEEIGRLNNLQILVLSDNELERLPEELAELSNLDFLDLRSNMLETLPEWLAQMPNLRFFFINNNPIKEPPPELLGTALTRHQPVDLKAIRRYYTQLREEGQDTIYEAKLLVIGEGGVGKTSLSRKLEDEEQPLLPDEGSTTGIDVIDWDFNLPEKHNQEQYHVNIWDFGGQAIYFATHQFFLTKRSVYVLVADTRQTHTDFYEWLRMQEAFGGDSPILLLKNRNREKGNRFYIENLPQIQKRFPNLKEIFELDLNNVPAEEKWPWLVKTLQNYFLDLEHVGQPIPKTWVRVREALSIDNRDTITQKQFLKICYEKGVKRQADALQLSDYLHHLGDILHFQDDPVLNKIVILKPTWGLDAVYRVLDNPAIVDNWGQFSRADLDDLWHESHYAGHHEALLRLMQNFQLCYRLPGQDDVYIAPQLLKPEVPDYQWDETDNLQLRYRYPVFMPRGILSRAIVKLHGRIKDQRFVWRSGVILKNQYAEAELLELRGENEIRIRISGDLKGDLLTAIWQALDELHQGFPKLIYQKLVPCKCSSCIDSRDPYFFDLDKLRERLSYRKGTIECQKPPYEMVDILSLIDDGLVDGRDGLTKDALLEMILERGGDFDIIFGNKIGGDIIGRDKAGGDIVGSAPA